MTVPELLRQTDADLSERLLGFAGELRPAPDSDFGNRSKARFLHGARPNKFAGQNPPIHLLMLALGFTLVELLIVIAIIGSLAAIAIPNYYKTIEKAQMTKIITEMKLLEREILIYQIDNEAYPDSLADIGRGGFLDPWGNPYEYLSITTGNGNGHRRKSGSKVPINTDFDLYSIGPDGKSAGPLTSANSYDDIVRGSNGAFIGPAWAY